MLISYVLGFSMAKKIKLKTARTDKPVSAYIESLSSETARSQATTLLKIFSEETGAKPTMWGNSIVGFGRYTYFRANGDEGEYMATGFSIRKSGPTLYIMPGYNSFENLLFVLGPHTLGKSCLYLKSLDDIHMPTLLELIRSGLSKLSQTHPVTLS